MTARTTNTVEHVEDVLRQIRFSGSMEFEKNDGKFRILCIKIRFHLAHALSMFKEVLLLGEADSRVHLDAVDLKPFRGAEQLISQWLESPLRSCSNIETLASMGKLENDDDPRIREMTGETSDELDKVFDLTKEIVMLKRIVEVSRPSNF